MRSRTAMIALVFTVALAALALAACGDGSRPAPIVSTVLPSPASSEPVTLSPTPGETTASPGATTSPAATATPGGGGGQGSTITDASIRTNILSRLAQAPELSGLRFKVHVRDRMVILRGVVKTAAQKTAAEQIAVTEPGIVKVLSYLFIEPEGDGGY